MEVRRGGRRGLLKRAADPFVTVLDPATGKSVRQWDPPPPAAGDALLIGEHLLLPHPALTAYALP